MHEELNKLASLVSTLESYSKPDSIKKLKAKKLLGNSEDLDVITLLMSLRTLYGIQSFYWEPETIMQTLRKDKLELPELTEDKLLAGLSVILNPSFFWDSLVFQRTVQAFNNVPYNAEVVQECTPAHMSWAVYAASLLRGLDPAKAEVPLFDSDVCTYTAVCLQRAGFVTPPIVLNYAKEALQNLLPKTSTAFSNEVSKTWQHTSKTNLNHKKYTETPIDIQLALLASNQLFEQEQFKHMTDNLLELEAII